MLNACCGSTEVPHRPNRNGKGLRPPSGTARTPPSPPSPVCNCGVAPSLRAVLPCSAFQEGDELTVIFIFIFFSVLIMINFLPPLPLGLPAVDVDVFLGI